MVLLWSVQRTSTQKTDRGKIERIHESLMHRLGLIKAATGIIFDQDESECVDQDGLFSDVFRFLGSETYPSNAQPKTPRKGIKNGSQIIFCGLLNTCNKLEGGDLNCRHNDETNFKIK